MGVRHMGASTAGDCGRLVILGNCGFKRIPAWALADSQWLLDVPESNVSTVVRTLLALYSHRGENVRFEFYYQAP